jgi:hypothetical protein
MGWRPEQRCRCLLPLTQCLLLARVCGLRASMHIMRPRLVCAQVVAPGQFRALGASAPAPRRTKVKGLGSMINSLMH